LRNRQFLSVEARKQTHKERESKMKRLLSVLLSLLIISSLFSFASAQTVENAYTSSTTEYYPDGSYGITTITVMPSKAFGASVTSSKSYHHYSASNVLLWTVKLTATFTYNGSTASCTNATPSYTVYSSVWKVKKAQASYSGNTATGEFTVKRYNLGIPVETVNKTLTLTCSPSGTVT